MTTRTVVVSLLLLSLALFAADPTGTINGVVTDASGAIVANAKLRATRLDTNFTRETVSGADGGFVFPLLPVGAYEVLIEVAGFRPFSQRGVRVAANVTVTVPVALQVGAVNEAVVVESSADLVDTSTGTLRQTIDQQRIVELPLNGRNAATLVLLAPGTADLNAANSRGAGDTRLGFRYPGAQSITAGGARADGVNYQLDGGTNRDPYLNVNNPIPNPDALEEFTVQTNNYSAEHGNATGAMVSIVTKSGTNQFHGSAFEFLRNGAMNSRNFFAARKDALKRNQFGGTLGGPLIRDRLFFFGSYQGTTIRSISATNTAIVPTDAQRRGDFSALPRQLVDPVTRVPFGGNQIPASRFDPVTLKVLNTVPTTAAADGRILFQRPQRDGEQQLMGRSDYHSSKHRLYGRYFYSRYPIEPVLGTDTNLLRAGSGNRYFNHGTSGSHTWNIRPNILNSLVVSNNRVTTNYLSAGPYSLTKFGMKVADNDVPEIRYTVTGFFTVNTSRPIRLRRNTYHFADNVNVILGRHQLYFGGEIMHAEADLYNPFRQVGFPTFRRSNTRGTGEVLPDMLIGSLDQFIQGGGEFGVRRLWSRSLFVQDNFRVSRTLTLNLGVRWDPFTPLTEKDGKTACYVPGLTSRRFPNAPNGYLYQGDPGCPSGGSAAHWALFAPRIGFAYNVDGKGKTTIRGGAGLSYQPPFIEAYNNMSNTPPFSPQIDLRRDQLAGMTLIDPYGSTGVPNPFPAQYGPKAPAADATFQLPVVGVSYATDWKPSAVWTWNLTVERQLASNLLVRALYAGSKGTHLGFNTDLNPAVNGVRPNLSFGRITQNTAGGNSNYHSLVLGIDRRFAHGFSIGANFTWAKSIDWASFLTDLDGVNIINPYKWNAYRAVSDYDIPRRLVLNYLWQLPGPKNGIARHLLGGWQTNGIWNIQSGFPLTINSGSPASGTLINNDTADLVSKPSLVDGDRGQRILRWFTTEAFRDNAPGTFGQSGRNILRGPRTFNVDLSVFKNIPVNERMKLQYRAEFFNAFNHTLLNNPGTAVGSPDFGRIVSARDPRIIQMALRILF